MEPLLEMAKFFIMIGIFLIVTGILLVVASKFNGLGLGHLPGDIIVKKGNFTFYFPIVSCIVISIVLTLLFSLFKR